MASHRIHVDQENRVPELRQKQANNAMAAPQRRPVLGEIDHNKVNNKAAPKGKQQQQPAKRGIVGANRENVQQNQEKRRNLVVPVAQFEAFSVYEDEEYVARIDQRLRMISKSNVYKGTEEDRFITKTELAEIERKKNLERLKDLAEIEEKRCATPMSVEKGDGLAANAILKGEANKDGFFEMKEYRDDIYAYLREHELRHRPKSGYIIKQPDVTDSMRAILIDWLVEVTEEYKMHTETLYLAVNFIDRFLSYMSVVRAKLQLVGTAAMFIASKYEEIFPPEVADFVYITDDTYNKQQVVRMEHLILRVLGFDLSVPTPLTFINAICIEAKLKEKTLFLAMYMSELSILDVEQYLQFLPSVIAASALALSRHTLGNEAWDENMQKSSGYALKDLEACILFLHDAFVKAPSREQHAIQDKYKSGKYMQVSKIPPRDEMISFD